jgi:tRNA threonylcarbamoyladenosine biosynthesis protein TsaB
MKILGIDTSTACGSVGLVDDERIIAEHLLNTPVTHSERLLGAIESVLREGRCSMSDLDGWAISLGPGSFTGLRIGVSTVKGLSFATGKPVVGVPTLDALASQVSPTPYLICPVLDARKREVYASFYHYDEENGTIRRQSPYQAIRPEHLIQGIEKRTIFIGEGVRTYGNLFKKSLPSLAAFACPSLNILHGSTVADLGLELLHLGEVLDLSSFTPIYIRPSEAEMKLSALKGEASR